MGGPVIAGRGWLRADKPRAVRTCIAQWWLFQNGVSASTPDRVTLGDITLRPRQLSAVARVEAAIAEFGGALLCDEVGTGKTFIALAVARTARQPLVVAPASLRDMWHRAAEQIGVSISFTSFEQLSRSPCHPRDFAFLIIDEAHHARNSSTARYRALSALASSAPTLLLSATPVHNRAGDISSLIALFLGSQADSLDEHARTRCIIRHRVDPSGAGDGMPQVEPPAWCHISHDEALPASLLALPPPLPPRDGGDGGVLIARSLIRQWASSDAALAGGLRRRLQKSEALIAGLEDGVYPSCAELAAWAGGEDSMQLAFSQMVAPGVNSPSALLMAATAHRDAVRLIYRARSAANARDQERATVLGQLARQHDGVKIVAFSQYSETVTGLYRSLASRKQAAALTARSAIVAGGLISRTEALDRFAPLARGVQPPRAADEISLLLTTDLLSEGVNLQDAGVVVHLDLPWTPARLEQRMGRIVRIGSRHDRVWSYALRPPASAETLLRIERIIEHKIEVARAIVGDVRAVVPSSRFAAPSSSRIGMHDSLLDEAIRRIMTAWIDGDCSDDSGSHVAQTAPAVVPLVAAVSATSDGFLAACIVGGRRVLLASIAGRATGDLRCVFETAARATGAAAAVSVPLLRDALLQLHAHFHECGATEDMTQEAVSASRMRHTLLRRISAVAGRARPHLRSQTAAAAQHARSVVLGRYGIAAEAALCRLASSRASDEDWLESINEFGRTQPQFMTKESDAAELVALILLQCSNVNALSRATNR
ncbi:MAG: DEAD/DEAH box helicase [Gemmatimonadaceae bacterium]|nr:DEAD/DEAH box helicase [Gemmatimonadaceae bacterium]